MVVLEMSPSHDEECNTNTPLKLNHDDLDHDNEQLPLPSTRKPQQQVFTFKWIIGTILVVSMIVIFVMNLDKTVAVKIQENKIEEWHNNIVRKLAWFGGDNNKSDGDGSSSSSDRHTYQRRGRPLTETEKTDYAKEWGSWTFVDPTPKKERPKNDYYNEYPNRDIPRNKFPTNAWQTDTQYLTAFLKEAKELVERSMEVILAEYGYGKNDLPEEDFETRYNKSPFKLEFANEEEERRKLIEYNKLDLSHGGWTTQRSYDGLVRRLLHAIMTEDRFVLVTGGHSAAAGHG